MATKRELRGNNVLEKLRMGIHDIQSPIASLYMLLQHGTNLNATEKKLLDGATRRLTGTVESMNYVLQSSTNSDFTHDQSEETVEINLVILIDKISLEKRYEYKDSKIQFLYTPNVTLHDCVITGNINELERMLSNLLNNCVEACGEDGVINLDLVAKNGILCLTITDNGKGMPAEILQKLRDGVAVTHGKSNGHGIGFMQIRDSLKNLNATLDIESTVGVGSKFSLQFSTAN